MRLLSLVSGCALAAGLFAAPAAASVMVVGNSPGYTCYTLARAQDGTPSALRRCNEAMKSDLLSFNDRVATYVNRGIVRMHGGDNQGAVADFDEAIAMKPSEPESYFNKGAAYIRMGRPSNEAIALFDRALELNTSRPELAYFSRGIAHEVAGNLTAAYRDYQRAQQLAPRWDQPGKEMSRFQVRRASATRM